MTGGGVGIGGIAGQNTSTGTIDGILLKGKIDAGNNSAVGGIAGANTGIYKIVSITMLLLVAIVLSEELLDRIMGISLTVSMMEVLREMNLSAGFVDKIK